MKVRAVKPGFFGGVARTPGATMKLADNTIVKLDEFTIPDEPKDPQTGKPKAFSDAHGKPYEGWMEEIKEEKPAPRPAAAASAPAPAPAEPAAEKGKKPK